MCISTDFKCPLLQNWFFFSFLMLCKNVYISKIFNEKEIGVQFHLPLNVLVHLSFFLKKRCEGNVLIDLWPLNPVGWLTPNNIVCQTNMVYLSVIECCRWLTALLSKSFTDCQSLQTVFSFSIKLSTCRTACELIDSPSSNLSLFSLEDFSFFFCFRLIFFGGPYGIWYFFSASLYTWMCLIFIEKIEVLLCEAQYWFLWQFYFCIVWRKKHNLERGKNKLLFRELTEFRTLLKGRDT